MKLFYEEFEDFILVDKPVGLNTHRSDENTTGMIELFEAQLQKKLWVVHRLDKSTSGALIFAKTETAAARLSEDFKNHRIQKSYFFVTDKPSKSDHFIVKSKIEKKASNTYASDPNSREPNAETEFKRVKRSAFFELWQAFPKTGKPHQVRLHAQHLGLTILGDQKYGGTEAHRIFLHSHSLKLSSGPTLLSPIPRIFERLGILRDSQLTAAYCEVDQRFRLYRHLQQPDTCLRLSHTDQLPFTLDSFGPQAYAYWYQDRSLSKRDLERFQALSDFLGKPLWVREMYNRGDQPNQSPLHGINSPKELWTATENGLKFEFRSEQGLSPGLFLDQRENRALVTAIAANKSVLNLFAYTCGFSLAAALGGAKEVVSVDLSKNFLEWGKRNFSLNDLDATKYEFYAADTEFFLERTLIKNRKFDLIVLDPPSFGRNGKAVFQIEKDLPRLLQGCQKLLNPQGQILVSCNYEKWTAEDFFRLLEKTFPKASLKPTSQGLDYELPDQARAMKSVLVSF